MCNLSNRQPVNRMDIEWGNMPYLPSNQEGLPWYISEEDHSAWSKLAKIPNINNYHIELAKWH